MPPLLAEILPDPELLLRLEPEELAGVVLQFLNMLPPNDGHLNHHAFGRPLSGHGYPAEYQERIGRALMEAWSWLEREGMIAYDPGGVGGDWVFVTRRGARMKTAADLQAYRRAELLPRQLLHPAIAAKVVGPFIRGDYDTAVFQAFKEVEVVVRATGKFADTDIGVPLMRKAFDAKTGPLRDPTVVEAEREATAHLFAGAVGSFKNPQSHRHVAITDPAECVELLLMASHLLRIVDGRKPIA